MNMDKRLLSIVGLVAIGVIGRLLPHLPNATPITAITLAAQQYVGRRWSFIIPIAAMVISDALIGFYDWRIMMSVYCSFALIGVLSSLRAKYPGFLTTALVVISAPLLFFLLTNFAVWLFSPWYAKSIAGLFYCYGLGIPFLRSMLIGDICYSTVILGTFELLPIASFTLRSFYATYKKIPLALRYLHI